MDLDPPAHPTCFGIPGDVVADLELRHAAILLTRSTRVSRVAD
jgi:hypothetical protein